MGVEHLQPEVNMSPRYQNRIELLQGTLDLLILQTLRWGPQHGYGISQAIRTNSGDILQVDTGSLYPALHRLERQKWISADWKVSENKQRVQSLPADGQRQKATRIRALALGAGLGCHRRRAQSGEEGERSVTFSFWHRQKREQRTGRRTPKPFADGGAGPRGPRRNAGASARRRAARIGQRGARSRRSRGKCGAGLRSSG